MDSSEKIIDAVYGIFKSAVTGQQTVGLGKLSFGTYSNTENTIFVTDSRLLFVSVPVTGGGLMLGGLNVSLLQSSFNSKGIMGRGEEMRNSMTPQAILESDKTNFELPFSMITSFKVRTFFGVGVTLEDSRGQKYVYAVCDKEALLRLAALLKQKVQKVQ